MLIAYRDYVASSTLSVLGGYTGFETEAPLDNVKDRRLAIVARKLDTSAVGIRIDLATAQTIQFFAILAHNATPADAAQVSGTLSFYNSGGLFGTDNFSGIYTPPVNSQFPKHYFILTPGFDGSGRQAVTRIDLELAPGSVFAEPFEIGRLFAGPIWRPEGKTSNRDFRMRTLDQSVVNESIGNQAYVDYKPRRRQLSCRIPYLTEEEAIGTEDGETQNLQDIGFEVGIGAEIVVIPSTRNNQVMHKFGIRGRFAGEPPAIDLMDANEQKGILYTSAFDVIEEM